jgi:ribosomal protein L11
MRCPHCGNEIPGMTIRPTPLEFTGPAPTTLNPLTVNMTAGCSALSTTTVTFNGTTLPITWTVDERGNRIGYSPPVTPIIDSTIEEKEQDQD